MEAKEMKEFSTPISLNKGLRRTQYNPRNEPSWLTECFNMKVKEWGLTPYVPLTDPFTNGPDIVLNGTFEDNSEWTFGDGWSYDAGNKKADAVTPGGKLQQTFSDSLLAAGKTYKVGFQVSSVTAGGVKIDLGGTVGSTEYTVSSTYTETIVCGNDPTGLQFFSPSNDFEGKIDNVTIKSVGIESDAEGYPILFRGTEVTLLCYKDRVCTVDESTWVATLLTTYDGNDTSTVKNPTADERWQFVDMGDAWYLINGTSIVYKTYSHRFDKLSEAVYVQDIAIKAGCANRGRVILGGMPSTIWNVGNWEIVWDRWKDANPQEVDIDNDDIANNYVFWSSIGEGLLWLFHPELAVEGYVEGKRDIDDNLIMDMLRRNELGWMPMPFQGSVIALKALGKHTIVYGEDGVVALTPVVDPISTMSITKLLSVGISGPTFVGGSKEKHLFIDQDGYGWIIDENLKKEKIDYSEFFSGLTGLTIAHDPWEDEFYITDRSTSYILTSHGLSEHDDNFVTSIINKSGTPYGIFSNGGDTEVRITTDTFDLDYRGFKMISSIDVNMTSALATTLAVASRFNKALSLVTSPYRAVNREGVVRINMSGLDFRVHLKITSFTNADIDDMTVHWQRFDKRNVRGTSVSSAASRTSI